MKLAADSGHVDAQFRYGQCLLFGLHYEKNLMASQRYLNESADNGNSFAEAYYDQIQQFG
jgi:TPR repeat protein